MSRSRRESEALTLTRTLGVFFRATALNPACGDPPGAAPGKSFHVARGAGLVLRQTVRTVKKKNWYWLLKAQPAPQHPRNHTGIYASTEKRRGHSRKGGGS